MKKCLLLCSLILTFTALADDSKHMVSLGRNGMGWSGSYESIDGKSRSPFDDAKHVLSNLGLNYAYRLGSNLQLGGFYQVLHDEYRFYKKGGGESYAEVDTDIYGIFALYNFSTDFTRSFYLGATVSYFSMAEENSHNWTETEGKAPFELDDEGESYELIFGKRFSFSNWGIEHLTFSPSVSFYLRNHSKDFDDQKMKPGRGVSFQLIKFDFLF